MESSELWTTIGLVLGGILLASQTYFKTNPRQPRTEPEAAAMGLLMDRDTVRNMADNLERCADALEKLADKKQDHMSDSIDKMLQIMADKEKRDGR